LDDAGVDTIFEKNTCNMVRGEMVLIRGVRYGTLYKLLGRTYTNGCNIYVFLEKKNKEYKTNIIPEKEDYAVASKTRAYWRKGPSNTR
jgi:hypothetical protein